MHRPYSLTEDASPGTCDINGDLGSILCQTDEEGEERVKAFASKQATF
jgi:hypothetical protein